MNRKSPFAITIMLTVIIRPISGGNSNMALETEIAAFEHQKAELEHHHMGKFVVFHGEKFLGAFDTLDNAATAAIEAFGRSPFLIRQVGQRPLSLPMSAMYRDLTHARS